MAYVAFAVTALLILVMFILIGITFGWYFGVGAFVLYVVLIVKGHRPVDPKRKYI